MFERQRANSSLCVDAEGGMSGFSIYNIESHIFRPYQIDGREGVSIFYLYDARQNAQGPAAALVRYAAGALTPRHLHQGWELLQVIEGELIDDRGCHGPGIVQVYPPGSTHELSSNTGCTFLVVWEQPVRPVTSPGASALDALTPEALI